MQLQQLKELLWVEQAYNLILLRSPGVGKTHLAIGLGIEAIRRGYKVSFIQMDALIHLFKTQEITRSGRVRIKRIISSDLVIIDDLGIPASNAITMFYKQIILRKGLPFEVKLPDHPLDVSRMTTEQLNTELEKGYAQMQNGQTLSAEQAFADIRKKYGV
ncbi:hypothetical protein DESHY_160042 [Desulforamulus hydrothermalis Lam5 = DSM 18033]|uniref:IstB-like ATP-binding domain-containing protein n=2 Tax=Desulforamulus TaxID=2916693 RepID=K8E8T5_9FIRM|nr:hypothetical protein DESHY_160042 [Desulforamulus hydrothermalis Lam5 = DSM 18033]